MLGKLEETAKGIAWNYQVPEAMTQAADQAAGYLRIGMAVSVILGLCFILLAYRVKVKAKRLGRLAFLWNTGMTVAVLWWATDTNMALNLLEGRENNFMNLTIYSHVQLTAAAYLQIVLALLIVPFLGKLLDTRKEYAAEYYQTRIETKDTGIGKRTILAFALILTAIPAVIFFGIFFLNDRSDYFISLCIIILSMLPFFLVFENRRPVSYTHLEPVLAEPGQADDPECKDGNRFFRKTQNECDNRRTLLAGKNCSEGGGGHLHRRSGDQSGYDRIFEKRKEQSYRRYLYCIDPEQGQGIFRIRKEQCR